MTLRDLEFYTIQYLLKEYEEHVERENKEYEKQNKELDRQQKQMKMGTQGFQPPKYDTPKFNIPKY
jgi:predicted nucleic acid-binding protein